MYREVNEMPKCASCGILIPCSELVFEHHGVKLYACSRRCTRVYSEYKFPRHRDAILALEAEGLQAQRLGYVTSKA